MYFFLMLLVHIDLNLNQVYNRKLSIQDCSGVHICNIF